jgi:hypothetical protein
MHTSAPDLDIIGGVDSMQVELAPRSGDNVFNQCTGKVQTTIIIQITSGGHGAAFE